MRIAQPIKGIKKIRYYSLFTIHYSLKKHLNNHGNHTS